MVNFENLVTEELLNELADPVAPTVTTQAAQVPATQAAQGPNTNVGTTANTTTAQNKEASIDSDGSDDEKLVGDTLFSFFEKQYADIKSKYTKRYNDLYSSGITFPTEDEFKTIVYAASKNSIRNTKDSNVFPDIRNTFPLLDLVATAKNKAKGHAKDPAVQAQLQKVYTEFLTRLNQTNTKLPLDYTPIDPWALSVRQDFYKKNSNNVVGQLTLDKVLDKSVLDVILYLLAARKNYITYKVDPKAVKSKFGVSSVPYVEDLIFNFQKYGSGETKVPAQFSLLYDQTTPRELIHIGSAAYEYVVAESKRLNLEIEQSKMMEAFKAFVQNAPLIKKGENNVFDWSAFIKQQEEAPTSTVAKESIFDSVYNNLLLELGPSDIDPRTPTERRNDIRKNLNMSKNARQGSKFNSAFKNNSSTEEPQQINNEQPQEPNGGYILRNIPKDSELYKALLGLAEYIKTASKRDITGALSAAAGAARALLGKTMG